MYGNGLHKTIHEAFADGGYTTATVGKVFHTGAELNAISSSLDFQGPGINYGPQAPSKFTSTALTGNLWLIDWGPYPATDAQTPDYQSVTWALDRMQDFAASPPNPFCRTVGIGRPHVAIYVPQQYFTACFGREITQRLTAICETGTPVVQPDAVGLAN